MKNPNSNLPDDSDLQIESFCSQDTNSIRPNWRTDFNFNQPTVCTCADFRKFFVGKWASDKLEEIVSTMKVRLICTLYIHMYVTMYIYIYIDILWNDQSISGDLPLSLHKKVAMRIWDVMRITCRDLWGSSTPSPSSYFSRKGVTKKGNNHLRCCCCCCCGAVKCYQSAKKHLEHFVLPTFSYFS